jgi:DNA primase
MWKFVNQCQEWLSQSPGAIAYLSDRRHLSAESIGAAKIGYYPRWADFPPSQGCPPELSCLKGRIVVPILSEFGKMVVACAGRVPDPAVKGAWWNTAKQGLKTSHLYGLSAAREEIFRRNKAYVFEGYMDRLVLAQHGLPNSVAAMSTNVGIRRLGLLARYCERICLCYDTDKNDSGQLGMLRTLADIDLIGIGTMNGICGMAWEVTVIKLPQGEDPDDFVHANGLEAFLALERPIGRELLKDAEKAHDQLKLRLWERKRKENDQHERR